MADFIYPTDTKRITSHMGKRWGGMHWGVDFADAGYHPIFAVADGTVTRSYTSSSYGECITIKHSIKGKIYESLYAHMRSGSRKVKVGQRVQQGQVIGVMGNTGQSTGQHLHFELHQPTWNINKTNAVNPLDYLKEGISKMEAKKLQDQINKLQSQMSKLADENKKLAQELAKKENQKTTKNTPSPSHKPAWDWIKAKKISNGERPLDDVRREQLATILQRYHETFHVRDGKTPSPSHAEAWKWLKDQKLSNGERPREFMSREQFASLLNNYHGKIIEPLIQKLIQELKK